MSKDGILNISLKLSGPKYSRPKFSIQSSCIPLCIFIYIWKEIIIYELTFVIIIIVTVIIYLLILHLIHVCNIISSKRLGI